MKCRLFNLLAAVSLVLCAATLSLWMISSWRNDWFTFTNDQGAQWFTGNQLSQLRFGYTRPLPGSWLPRPKGFTQDTTEPGITERVPGSNVYLWGHGFGLVTGERWNAYHYEILIPHWALVVASIMLPVMWLCRRNGSDIAGHCSSCGYDLRATPERCPECGTAVPAPQPAEANT